MVAKKDVGQYGSVRRVAVAKVDVQKAVVVDVAEIGAHGHEHFVESGFRRYIFEGSIPQIFVKLQGAGIVRKVQVGADGFIDGGEIAIYEQVRPAAIVVIEEPGNEAAAGSKHARLEGDVRESIVMIVVIETVFALVAGDVEIDIAIVVVVGCNHALGQTGFVDARGVRDILEGSV